MQTKLDLYQKVTPLAHLGIWERNLATGKVYWNTVMREIYEVDSDYDPTLEKSINFYTDTVGINELIKEAINTGLPQKGQFELKGAKGTIKSVRVRIRADFEDGKCTLIYGTVEDITEQVNLINKLAEQKEQFHQAFENAPIGMALVSIEGEWIRVNKTICEILNCDERELLARTFQSITHPDDLDSDLNQMQELLAGKIDSYQMDKRYIHKDGSLIWVSLSVSLVRDQQGKPLYFVSQIKDISDRKKMELERARTFEIIKAQNDRLLNFAHIVSHNLRSHIGNIQMLTNLIVQETDIAEKDHLIGMLGINAANLQDTLMHLNDVVNVHANDKRDHNRLNLLQEIEKITTSLSESIKQTGTILTIQVSPKLELDYDPAYLESILLNLLTNAIKYRDPQRQLNILVKATNKQGRVNLEIKDNGVGMDMELHGHKLFGMYKTFHGNSDARGIGLFLVKNQLEAMGSHISTESRPGKGTRFKIEF